MILINYSMSEGFKFFIRHLIRSALPRAEEFYSCQEDAVPVLHDTAIHLNIIRSFNMNVDHLSDISEKETLQV